jgi:hypothetical protein
MYKELSYETLQGHTVFTSQFLKNRGTCCKSACLHCPYGYTIKKLGIQFREVQEEDFSIVESVLQENAADQIAWKEFWPDNIRLITLKEEICGLFLKNHIIIKHLFLKPHFQQQNISKELVESYFF